MHLAAAAMTGVAPAKAAAAKDVPAAEEPGEERIAALSALLQPPSTALQPGQTQPGEAASEILQASSPLLAAETSAVDRMREAEQRHVDKLRGRAASMTVHASRHAVSTQAGDSPAKQRQQRPQAAGPSYGSGLAKSASHLLSKLLGKKDKAVSPSKAATASPSPAAAASSTRTAAHPSSSTRRGSAVVAERSASSVAAYAGSSSSVGGSGLAAGLLGHSKAPQKPGMLGPATRAGAGAPQTSPRSPTSQEHARNSMLMQGRAAAATKPGVPATVTLHSPMSAGRGHLRPRGALSSSGTASPRSVAQHGSAGGAPSPAASGAPAGQVDGASTAASDAGGQSSKVEFEAVQPSSNSKTVRFAGPLACAGPSAELQVRRARGAAASFGAGIWVKELFAWCCLPVASLHFPLKLFHPLRT